MFSSFIKNDFIYVSEYWHIAGQAPDEDASDKNGKTSIPPSPIPSIYNHYLHILLMPPQNLTWPWKSNV